MTTSKSPPEAIRRQAAEIVYRLKQGVGAVKGKDSIAFAIAQDDKIVKITMTWKQIHALPAKDLMQIIFDAMTA